MDVFTIERALRDSALSWSRVQEVYIFYWTGPGQSLNNGQWFTWWKAAETPNIQGDGSRIRPQKAEVERRSAN